MRVDTKTGDVLVKQVVHLLLSFYLFLLSLLVLFMLLSCLLLTQTVLCSGQIDGFTILANICIFAETIHSTQIMPSMMFQLFAVSKNLITARNVVFRHARVSSTYPCLSVRRLVGWLVILSDFQPATISGRPT